MYQPPPAQLRLRLRIIYSTGGGEAVQEQVMWTEEV
jgi:hypothetical protein